MEFAQYLHYFEVEALTPLLIGGAVSLALSALWLVVVMRCLQSRKSYSDGRECPSTLRIEARTRPHRDR